MGIDRPIDITAEQRKTVLALLQRHLPGTAAWVYGSRVKWTSRPQSDLDLVVFATPEQQPQIGDLREAFEESNLPFRVDLFVWDDVPESFRQQIEAEHVVLARAVTRQRDEGWEKVPLGNLVDIYDGPHATPKKTSEGPIFLGISNLASGRLDLQQTEHLSENDYPRWTRRVTPTLNDIVFSYETRLGQAALIPKGLRACLGRRMGLLRPRNGAVDARFLLYAFLGRGFQETLRSRTIHGSTVDRIPLIDMASFPIDVPRAIAEQRAIAHILGTLDDKIELNRRMNATLEALARALFKSWFVDFDPVRAKMEGRGTGLPKAIADLFPDRLVDSELGEIPEGWCASTLADIARLNPESWSNDNAPDRILYVDLAKTKWGYIDDIRMYSWANAPSRGRRVLRRGDTIVGTVRPGNGSFALIDRDGLTGSTGFAVLRPTDPIEREIVWCVATSHDAIDRLAHLADGGAYPAVNPKTVLDTVVILPDTHIRLVFSSLAAPLVNRLQQNQREARTVGTIRDALLPKLMSGELRAPLADRQRGERPNG